MNLIFSIKTIVTILYMNRSCLLLGSIILGSLVLFGRAERSQAENRETSMINRPIVQLELKVQLMDKITGDLLETFTTSPKLSQPSQSSQSSQSSQEQSKEQSIEEIKKDKKDKKDEIDAESNTVCSKELNKLKEDLYIAFLDYCSYEVSKSSSGLYAIDMRRFFYDTVKFDLLEESIDNCSVEVSVGGDNEVIDLFSNFSATKLDIISSACELYKDAVLGNLR